MRIFPGFLSLMPTIKFYFWVGPGSLKEIERIEKVELFFHYENCHFSKICIWKIYAFLGRPRGLERTQKDRNDQTVSYRLNFLN